MLNINPPRIQFLFNLLRQDFATVPECVLTGAIIQAETELEINETLDAYSQRVREIILAVTVVPVIHGHESAAAMIGSS